MGASQNQWVSGSGNTTNLAGRDIFFGNIISQTSVFQKPDRTRAVPPLFCEPVGAAELLATLRRERLLILGGTSLQDKSELAEYLSWSLQAALERESGGNGGAPVAVLEAPRVSGRASLEGELHQAAPSSILILGDGAPHDVGHDLEKLQRTLARVKCYLLVATEKPRQEWGGPEDEVTNRFWSEPDSTTLYPHDYLAQLLGHLLSSMPRTSPGAIFPQDLSLLDAVRGLTSRSQVMSLCDWLTTTEEVLSRQRVLEKAQAIGHEKKAVQSWYRRLAERHQLLVTGCVLFEGLYSDQLLAALDLTVQNLWRPRSPALTCFDYQDLDIVAAYFKPRRVPKYGQQLVLSAESRDWLVGAVWALQRRHLLVVLPLVVELVREAGRREPVLGGFARRISQPPPPPEPTHASESGVAAGGAQEPGSNGGKAAVQAVGDHLAADQSGPVSRHIPYGTMRDLFGSPEHAAHFCESVGSTLGRLSQRYLPEVERCLSELASHESEAAQRVAALALGTWCQSGLEGPMLEILGRWYDVPSASEKRLAGSGTSQEQKEEQANTRATVALAVMSAAEQAREGQLPPPLLCLLDRLERESTEKVRERLCYQTTPVLVLWHQRQADPLLRRLVVKQDFRVSVALAWATALLWNPEPATVTLEEWCREEDLGQRRSVSEHTLSPREARLATVALCLGCLDYSKELCPIPLENAVSRLVQLLRSRNLALQGQVLMATEELIRRNFDRLREHLPTILETIPIGGRLNILKAFHDSYLEQRQLLGGGEAGFVFERRSYPIWLKSSRPLTAIEVCLEGWVRDPSKPAIQQMSLDALAWLANSEFAHAEQKAQLQALRPAKVSSQPPMGTSGNASSDQASSGATIRRLGPGASAVLSLLSCGQTDLTTVATHLAAEIVSNEHLRRVRLEGLLSVWERRASFSSLARLLSRFATWYRHRFEVGCLALILLFICWSFLLVSGLLRW